MIGKSVIVLSLNDTEIPKFASRHQIASGLLGLYREFECKHDCS